jgi:hypothetical protein
LPDVIAGCFMDSVSVRINNTKGALPFRLKWSNGSSMEQTNYFVDAEKSIFVIITDVNNCKTTLYSKIKNNEKPVLKLNNQYSFCGNEPIKINPVISGGLAPYTYLWSNGSTVADLNTVLKENSNLSDDDCQFLKNIPFELSGRKCSGVSVIEAVPVQMPELITSNPFCSIKSDHFIIYLTKQIQHSRKRLYELLLKDTITQKLIKKYGTLSEYPFGMTRYLKCPKEEKNGTYYFNKDKKGNDILLPEYNGSYHITFTLPYSQKTTNKEFIKMHKNFCNQLQ